MTQNPGGHHDDSTASTANCTAHTHTKSRYASIIKKNLAKTQRMKLFPLKFEYNVLGSNVKIAQLHGQVIKALITAYGDDTTKMATRRS
jgi:hypothetical protein